MTPGPGIEPGTHWWKASALTTAGLLLVTTTELLLVTNTISFQNYSHPEDHNIWTTDTPRFKPFTLLIDLVTSEAETTSGQISLWTDLLQDWQIN